MFNSRLQYLGNLFQVLKRFGALDAPAHGTNVPNHRGRSAAF